MSHPSQRGKRSRGRDNVPENLDVIYLEDLQVANLRRRPAPKPDGNGGYLPNGARRKAGLNKSISDAAG